MTGIERKRKSEKERERERETLACLFHLPFHPLFTPFPFLSILSLTIAFAPMRAYAFGLSRVLPSLSLFELAFYQLNLRLPGHSMEKSQKPNQPLENLVQMVKSMFLLVYNRLPKKTLGTIGLIRFYPVNSAR